MWNRITVFPNGSLALHRIEREDNGFYKCVALPYDSKDANTVQTFSIRLQIACKSRIDSIFNSIFI